jgi:glutaconyl-CoA/methylmalonyl-CoA decarboxylase subunit gamma
MMRRYTLDIRGRTFVVDVDDLGADRFQVVVGDDAYEVEIVGDQSLTEASITPALIPAGPRTAPSAPTTPPAPTARPAPAAKREAAPRAGGGASALVAPMPGVILDVSVKPGDSVRRGQEVAVLEAMKMQNSVKSPRDGTIAEVCVAPGQAVGHGDAIVRFASP